MKAQKNDRVAPEYAGSKSDSSSKNWLNRTELESAIDDFLFDCRYRGQSKRTLDGKKEQYGKYIWWLDHRKKDLPGQLDPESVFDTAHVRAFLHYVATGHEDPQGRWDNPRETSAARPATIGLYRAYLCALASYLIEQEVIDRSPLEKIKAPKKNADQIKPYDESHIQAFFRVVRHGLNPERDESILRFLLDTGVRASELCTLQWKDVDFELRCAHVTGKGNKKRAIYFGQETAKCLRSHRKRLAKALKFDPEKGPVFAAASGMMTGRALTRSGLLQLVHKWGIDARVQGVRVSPHTFRHTFALDFLRGGGNVFALQQLLGHTNLRMTQKYLSLAQGDIQDQHRQFSPGDKYK